MGLTAKANTVCLLEVLTEYSDRDNILKMGDIMRHMDEDYGLKLDRRTVYTGIDVLKEVGYDISTPEDNKQGYYIDNRLFNNSEVMMMVDSVYSNPVIPNNFSAELVGKLQTLLPESKRKSYKTITAMGSTRKTDNKEVFLNIDLLDEAIVAKKKVRFTYLKYGFNKKLTPKREGKYVVSPYAMVAANEHYYLLCNCETHSDSISQFRIDKIKEIEITDEDRIAPPEDFSPAKYRDRSIYMYGGKIETAVLRCDNEILDQAVDRFGRQINITKNDDDKTFDLTVTGSRIGITYWAVNYVDRCEVLSPASIREAVIGIIKNNKYGI